MAKSKQFYLRKAHRYLGLAIGIQFLGWTLSGLYFSWTDIDQIHGDQFHPAHTPHTYQGLVGLSSLDSSLSVQSLELVTLLHQPYYWVNQSQLIMPKPDSHVVQLPKRKQKR